MKPIVSFKRACDMTAALSAFLTVGMVFFPYWTISQLGVNIDLAGAFATRRMGLLFLGLLVLMVFSRELISPGAREPIAKSVATSMFTLAILGTIEYFRGTAGLSILYIAVLIEVVLFFAFLPYASKSASSV